jgi:hypothetical protein
MMDAVNFIPSPILFFFFLFSPLSVLYQSRVHVAAMAPTTRL